MSLKIDGDFDLGGFVFKAGVPFIHNDGYATYKNTAIGLNALTSATLGYPYPGDSGGSNTAVGFGAVRYTTEGFGNTGVGAYALYSNTTGSRNTAIGRFAGANWTNGFRNIAVGDGAYGVAGEASTIRIGGFDFQTRTFIAGIRDAITYYDDAVPVLIDSANQLGTVSSSARVKQDIQDLAEHSNRLMDLRPVAFRYRRPFAGGIKPIQFGLVAEEVAKVFPELVVYNRQGEPETVKYHWLSTLLLNELQKEKARRNAEVDDLRQQVTDLRRVVAQLGSRTSMPADARE